MSFIESNFLLKMVKVKMIMYLIHQIDDRPKYSFTSFEMNIFFNYRVFEIESCLLGR